LLISFSLFLAFRDLSSLRTHFWPFTEVVRRIRLEVTRKHWKTDEPPIAQTPRIGEIETTEDPDVTGWIERQASAAAGAHNGTFDLAHRRHSDADRREWINRLSYKSHRPGAMISR
jgi:hypothetical protein